MKQAMNNCESLFQYSASLLFALPQCTTVHCCHSWICILSSGLLYTLTSYTVRILMSFSPPHRLPCESPPFSMVHARNASGRRTTQTLAALIMLMMLVDVTLAQPCEVGYVVNEALSSLLVPLPSCRHPSRRCAR